MKKLILIIIVLLILIIPIYKWNTDRLISIKRWDNFVEFVKDQKTDNDFETVKVIDKLVRDNIDYKVYWYGRNLRSVWKDHKGDCTEIANSVCYFLNEMDIRCRTVHGKADGELHDWYEYRINNTWYQNETRFFDDLYKYGSGLW